MQISTLECKNGQTFSEFTTSAKYTCLDKEQCYSWGRYRPVLTVEQSGTMGKHVRITLIVRQVKVNLTNKTHEISK